ncbi:hypothetical protein ACJIZ3_004415 [Penstemon smallii]|uniref:Purple acid phosphatase n=1 Tax=Penstemon smallii TaxID=265156 RepID=A0ABD3S222_9LAMI
MARLCSSTSSNSVFIWTCFCVLVASNLAEFPRIKHNTHRNDDSVAFLVVGDWGRDGNYNQSRVAKQMGEVGKKIGIDFVISTGDNFYDTGLKSVNDPRFETSFSKIYTAKSLQKPWYTVLGNHDYLGNTEAQLSPALRKMDNRWHCKRNFIVGAGYADIFFIDTNPFVNDYFINAKKQKFDWKGILPRENYLAAVRKDLDSALSKSRAPWKIVVGHHPMRSMGYHGDTREIVDQILPILEAHKVEMYINGHDHCLEHFSNRKGSMQFLTSGGGSKAWKNKFHYGVHNNASKQFYYDGQGFLSVKLISRDKGALVFYDVYGKPLYSIKVKA